MKQQITKNAIETAFLKLLKERYFEKVMVKDVVEECGLTRNTFYYYYEDTYNIITDILERELRRIIDEMDGGTPLLESVGDTFEFLDENPRIAKHLFASTKKEEIYSYVRSAGEIVVRHWIEMETAAYPLAEADKRIIVNAYKYVIQGLISDWTEQGMRYSIAEEMKRTAEIFVRGLELVIRSNQDKT